MRLNLPILVGALGTALLCAYLGYYVPAAVLFIVYVLWTVIRDTTRSRHQLRGWQRR
jgi:hypothetical protein